MPAAIDLLSIVTRPDGLRASPKWAVVASTPTNKNKANLETVRILNIRPPPLNFDETIHKCIELVYGPWSNAKRNRNFIRNKSSHLLSYRRTFGVKSLIASSGK